MSKSKGRSGCIDYSKWDNIDVSDDEDENNDSYGGGSSSLPRVTKLDGASRVTRQSDGSVTIEPSHEENSTKPTTETSNAFQWKGPPSSSVGSRSDTLNILENGWTRNGGKSLIDDDKILYWCQDRRDVVLRFGIPVSVPGKDVRVNVKGALSYQDRASAVGVDVESLGSLTVSLDGKSVLTGDLPYPIFLAEDEEEVDWSIDNNNTNLFPGTKFVTITLHKAVPMEGICRWWNHPLRHMEKIDVSKLESRQSTEGDKQKQHDFTEAWNEAHRLFQEKMKAKKENNTISIHE